jgi:hypothetical protein
MLTDYSNVQEKAIFEYKTTFYAIDQKLQKSIFAYVIY